MDRLKTVSKDTLGVALWVFVSAGLTAILSWALQKPEFIQYYGLLNIALYFLNELKKGNEDK
jgi:hypothetical protein